MAATNPGARGDVGDLIQSTRFTMLDMMAFGFGILVMRFLAEEFLLNWFTRVMNTINGPVWTFGMPALGILLVLVGTRRVTTTISEADRKIFQQFYWLFFVPAGSKTYPFGQVRLVDFYHPGDVGGDVPAWMFFVNKWYYLWHMLPGLGSIQQYEVRVMLQDRTRLTVCSGHGHERMVDMATRIRNMTKSRLG